MYCILCTIVYCLLCKCVYCVKCVYCCLFIVHFPYIVACTAMEQSSTLVYIMCDNKEI